MKKKRGRPPKLPDERAEARIELRVLNDEKTQWEQAAERADETVAGWIRVRLNRAAKRELKRD